MKNCKIYVENMAFISSLMIILVEIDDGIHLSEEGTDIFASNFVNSVNDIIFNLEARL